MLYREQIFVNYMDNYIDSIIKIKFICNFFLKIKKQKIFLQGNLMIYLMTNWATEHQSLMMSLKDNHIPRRCLLGVGDLK